jgi:hypothetical protein
MTYVDRKHSFELAEIGNKIYTLTLANGIEKKSWLKHLNTIISDLGGSSQAKEESVTILRRVTQARATPVLRPKASPITDLLSPRASSSASSSSAPSSARSDSGSSTSLELLALEAKIEELTKALEGERVVRRQLENYTKSMSEMFRQMSAETKAEKLDEERKRQEEEERKRQETQERQRATAQEDTDARTNTLMQMMEKLTAENLELRAKLKDVRAQLKARE